MDKGLIEKNRSWTGVEMSNNGGMIKTGWTRKGVA